MSPRNLELHRTDGSLEYPPTEPARFHEIAAILALGVARLGQRGESVETSQKLAPEPPPDRLISLGKRASV